ncbi:MAG: tRNA pseudouridine(38-40) synthase TruA [Deltaproteobacteria bacterium RBG_16_50_11]|nr:MAG: tRNA pseudouridine(38-40) synthase TruA [Deltaproteobacteria bacterium RBG_16_50_11]
MRTIKLTIEYDGTNYQGWQVQPQGSTIQGVIEEKLSVLTGEKVHLIGAGRTDAGAHASGQVAHFKTESSLKVLTVQKALNSLLPSDMVIRKVEEVDENFHARKSSRSKIYEYRVLNETVRSPFQREYAWHIPYPLNWGEMKRATKKLIGQHDFSSFRSAGSSTRTSVRKVVRAEWKGSRDGLIRFEIEANGFLKQMVRAIVGTLVEVGKGKISAAEFQGIIESKDRKEAGPTAPAHGLFLKEVKY